MNKHFIVDGTDNVVDLNKYRNFATIKKLYAGYKIRVSKLKKEEIEQEKASLREELKRHPNNTMTYAKIKIFENATQTKL